MNYNWCFQDLMPLLSLTKILKKVKTITLKDILSNDPRVCQTQTVCVCVIPMCRL